MTPASSANLLSETGAATGFADGFGTRVRLSEGPASQPLDMLQLSAPLVAAPGFDFALRERVSRLTNFRHAYYARVRRVDRLDAGATLGLVSDAQSGARLSHVLEIAHKYNLDLDVNAALCLLRQIVPAVAMLHQNARDVSHGAIAPERVVVTSNARVVMVEYVLGAAVESLGYSRERLWKELRVAVPPGAGTPRLNHRVDVMQIGVVALALVLGRPLKDDDLRDLVAQLASATESSVMGGRQPISDPLRRWLSRALQLDPRGSFESALEAQLALDDVLSGVAGYIAAPVALESFLAQYEECAAKATPQPPPVSPATRPAASAPFDRTAEQGVTDLDVEPESDRATTPDAAPAPRVAVPLRPAKLGIAKVSANAPAVPSFRAVAAPSPTAPPIETPALSIAGPPPIAQAPEQTAPVATRHDSLSILSRPAPQPAQPTAVAHGSTSLPSAGEQSEEGPSFDDEAALRAQFLAVSGDNPGGGPGKWRLAAVALGLVALAEGAFIGWTMFGGAPLSADRGTLKVDSKPAGAQVKIDGEGKGATPLSVTLGSGAHVLEISAGGEPRVIPITIAGGETFSQYIELAGNATMGRLAIQSTPAGATVLVDGQPRGVTPLDLADVTAGEHEIVVDLNGQRVRQAVSVSGGVTTTLNLPMTAAGGSAAPSQELAAGLLPAAPTVGQVHVQVPFEMQVLEQGAPIGVTSNRLPLSPGAHDLEIVSETLAFRTKVRVDVVAGRTTRVPVALPKGTVHLNATPWAEVWVDGKKVGDTPIGNLPLTIGPHEIVFRHPELGEQAHAATVTAGAPVRLSVDLTRKP